MKIEVPTGWEGVTLGQLQRIDEVAERDDLDDEQKGYRYIGILAGLSPRELRRIPLADVGKITSSLSFLNEAPKRAKIRDRYEIGRVQFSLHKNIATMSTGQFIDLQDALRKEDISYTLAVLLVPSGYKYGEGYDGEAMRTLIRGGIGVPDALGIAFFFIGRWQATYPLILRYSARVMKKTAKSREQTTAVRTMAASAAQMLRQLNGSRPWTRSTRRPD